MAESMRMFIDEDISSDLADVIQESLVGCETKRDVDSVFDEVTSAILETAN